MALLSVLIGWNGLKL